MSTSSGQNKSSADKDLLYDKKDKENPKLLTWITFQLNKTYGFSQAL